MRLVAVLAHSTGALVVLLGLAGATCARANAVLAPHGARYSLSLHDSVRSPDVTALKGELEVRFEFSCDGWRLEQSLGFRIRTRDGTSLEHLAHLSGFEEHDGSRFTFSTRTWEDRKLADSVAGVVSRDPASGEANVRYAQPAQKRESLPRDVLLPGQHMLELLNVARSGGRTLMRTVFDGSSDKNPFQVSAWIGTPGGSERPVPGVLEGHVSWPVRLAYFDLRAIEPAADFEMSVQLYDNGVAGDMIYDYGDFAIDVRVEEVTLLPVPDCP